MSPENLAEASYFEVMFSGVFLVEIFILCGTDLLSPLEFPYAYTVLSDKEDSQILLWGALGGMVPC